MEFDLSWILLGLPVAFVLGWLASRWDLRQIRAENRQAPKAYFKGLNFLLNEQQDKAIDAFIEAVQNDPDTSELHFALGNLFRRRGEYNRAVRVHEHLLSRGDLSRVDRDRAQHALAQDFLKAGLLDRAEDALRRLEGTAFEAEARLALLAIYERSRDWTQAAAIARRMQDANQGTSVAGWRTTCAKTPSPCSRRASRPRRCSGCSKPSPQHPRLRDRAWSMPSCSIAWGNRPRPCKRWKAWPSSPRRAAAGSSVAGGHRSRHRPTPACPPAAQPAIRPGTFAGPAAGVGCAGRSN